MSGGFPIDLLLFGMIAAFLVLRLRGILGRRTGFERQSGEQGPVQVPGMGRPPGPVIDGAAEPAAATRVVPAADSAEAAVFVHMRAIDPHVDPARFLAGAEAAFRLIVGAYAAGDRVALRPLLDDDTYRSFEGAIAAREANGETQHSEIRGVHAVSVEAASLSGTIATVVVRFVSDQIAETLDRDGRPVAGTDAVTEITDIWTFERDLAQHDPAWHLTAARSG